MPNESATLARAMLISSFSVSSSSSLISTSIFIGIKLIAGDCRQYVQDVLSVKRLHDIGAGTAVSCFVLHFGLPSSADHDDFHFRMRFFYVFQGIQPRIIE